MKEFEHDDPMELRGVFCDGDPDYMLECLIEEYLRMGWTPARILQLFESPFYPPLNAALLEQGREAVRAKIEGIALRCGVFRLRTREAEPDAELVTIEPFSQGGREHE